MRTRQTVAHKHDCSAKAIVRRGEWQSPWYFPGGFRGIKGYVRRDSLGRRNKGGGEEWLVLRCNCASGDGCPAEMLVALDDILDNIPSGREEGR